MKRCPQCQQLYTDQNLFCLNDGTILLFDSSNPPLCSDDTPTVSIRQVSNPNSSKSSLSHSSNLIYAALGLVAVAVLVLGYFVFAFRFVENKSVAATQPSPTVEALPHEFKAENVVKSVTPQVESVLPAAAKPKSVTGGSAQTRIKFARGSVTGNAVGHLAAEASQRFVLTAKSGQFLSAMISSGNDCVVFSNNAASAYFATGSGNNYLFVKNICAGQSGFTVTVSIR